MKLADVSKRTIAIASGVIIIGSVAGAAALTSSQSTGATNTTPIEQQVDKNTQTLDNHEARITNTENNVKDLQASTNTSPSVSNVPVPVVGSTQPSSQPQITVTSYSVIPTDSEHQDCILHYSDGTNNIWHWITPTGTTGVCDSSLIGQPKS